MPYYKKKRYKKKRYNRRKQYTPSPSNVLNCRKNSPLPTKFKATLKYVDQTTLDHGGAFSSTHVYSLSGLFDVDITGVGHQPSGYDEIMPMYDHYNVIFTKIQVNFQNRDNVVGQLVGLTVRDSTSASVDYRALCETGNTTFTTLTVEGGNHSTATLRMNVNPNKFLGRSKPLADPQLKGAILANPTEQAFLHVWAAPLGGVDAGIVDVQIVLEYTVIFTEPTPVGLS